MLSWAYLAFGRKKLTAEMSGGGESGRVSQEDRESDREAAGCKGSVSVDQKAWRVGVAGQPPLSRGGMALEGLAAERNAAGRCGSLWFVRRW